MTVDKHKSCKYSVITIGTHVLTMCPYNHKIRFTKFKETHDKMAVGDRHNSLAAGFIACFAKRIYVCTMNVIPVLRCTVKPVYNDHLTGYFSAF